MIEHWLSWCCLTVALGADGAALRGGRGGLGVQLALVALRLCECVRE